MALPSDELREAEAYVERICAEDCWKYPREYCPMYENFCKAYVFGDDEPVDYKEGLVAAYRKAVKADG